MLVVRDTKRCVFGCFTAEPWSNRPRYYGNGETFIFQIQACARLVLRVDSLPAAVCKRHCIALTQRAACLELCT